MDFLFESDTDDEVLICLVIFNRLLLNKTNIVFYNPLPQGQNGFEELRRYVKQGGDFGKDLAAILQERLEAEHVYSKALSKMALKLNKTCREIPGSLAEAWRAVATEMEGRGEVHRQFSKSLGEEIVKPLKEILDGQHKTRKTVCELNPIMQLITIH